MQEERERPRTARRRWPRLLGGALLVLLLAVTGLWLERKPLATRYADRFLASKGVPARYGIADLGFGRQRLVNVVLGDPAHPDLVADWLEARTTMGLHGPYLTGVRAGHLRLRARLVDGRLSFGSIDRLLPRSEGNKPFALPALAVDVSDARVRLETPYGIAGLKLAGSGRLDRDFAATVAVSAPRLGQGGCSAEAVAAVLHVQTSGGGLLGGAPGMRLTGPVRAGAAACRAIQGSALRADINLMLDRSLKAFGGSARLATGPLSVPDLRLASLGGLVEFDPLPFALPGGDLNLIARGARLTGLARNQATAASVSLRGPWSVAENGWSVGSRDQVKFDRPSRLLLAVHGARADGRDLDALLAPLAAARWTPLAPLMDHAASGTRRAAHDFDAEVALSFEDGKDGQRFAIFSPIVRARSGFTLRSDLSFDSFARGPDDARLHSNLPGTIWLGGGGLPSLRATVRRAIQSRSWHVGIEAQPYAAGGARLAVTPIELWSDPAGWRVATTATVSGPLADGRVDGLVLPIDARRESGRLTVGQGCVPLRWTRIAVSGLRLDGGGLRLCPTDGALVSVAGGRVAGGAQVAATRLTGQLGDTPLSLAADGARVQLDGPRFAMRQVAARLGRPGRVTRLDIASLEGRAGPGGLAGRFTGAGGQIGAVPLLLSDAAGAWRLTDGALSLTGGLTVSDAQADRPRFRPVSVRDVSLGLKAGAINADGVVLAPGTSGRKVANVSLTNVLKTGAGTATFTVPGLLFDKQLQPDQLTPLTFGVIADVRGTVTGEGRIGWSEAGVTSTGTFGTTGTDLAAAFGPVQGIAGTVRFDNLLALRSAPGQQVTVRQVNPGIPVTDGVVRFQTLPDARVQVEGARWPFAGGTLTLEPTLLDFGAAAERRMTFRVDGMRADQFLQQFDFKNLDATGTFDGVLPMAFDQAGGRIENGRLVVRPGGGQIAYVGPISQKDVGFWPNLAFQALKSLRYRSLTIGMDGPLAGEMVTEVRFAGISQGEGAKRTGIAGLLVGRLQRLPFVFNIRIRAPFRGLLDATASFYDPKRLIQRNLPQLLDEQDRRNAIQPPASRTVP